MDSQFYAGNGELYTWGWNWHGQLGHGDMRDLLLAQPVRTLALVRALTQTFTVAVAAGKEHSIALTNTGAVYSWGGGREGQLGSGEEEISQPVPRLITKFYAVRVAMVCASGDHSLALAEGGVVHSWGKGANGTLGHGDVLNYPSPTVVKALIGLYHTFYFYLEQFSDIEYTCDYDCLWLVSLSGSVHQNKRDQHAVYLGQRGLRTTRAWGSLGSVIAHRDLSGIRPSLF